MSVEFSKAPLVDRRRASAGVLRFMSRRPNRALLLAGASMCASSSIAFAQGTPSPAPAPNAPVKASVPLNAESSTAPAAVPSNGVSEVVVTARRRSENIERVPTAITAFNAEQMAQRGINSDTDLQLTVPGLTIRETEGQNQLTYAIRGQTVDQFTGSPSAVVAYVDEVQLNVGGASRFFDLDSVQVLKGPQGTLFGRNATGGAVLYTTTKPTDTFGGYLEVRGGDYSLQEVQGAVNLPIVDDKVLLRVAFDEAHRDGYIHDEYFDTDLGELNRQSGRVSLTLKPIDRLTNTTVVEYDYSGGTNTGASYLWSVNPVGITNRGYTPSSAAAGVYGPADPIFPAYLAGNPRAYPGGIVALANQQRAAGPFVSYSDSPSEHRERDAFLANTTTFDLGHDMQIRNILGASYSHSRDDASETADPYGIEFTDNLALGQFGDVQQVTQTSDELQLQGKTLDSDLQYITGVFAQETTTHIFYPQSYFDLEPVAPPSTATSNFRLKDLTEAIYAQGTYDLGRLTGIRGLGFTAGIRYTWEQVSLAQLPGSDVYPAPHQEVDFSDPSWEVGLQYQITPQLMTYVKTRGSFRSGGLNGVAPPIPTTAAGGGDEYLSEHTQDVEGGFKYSGRLHDIPSQLNVAVFNQWIQNPQRAEFPVVVENGVSHSIAVTINVPSAEVTGIEADGSIRPFEWLELGASGAYTDARYTGNTANLFGVTYLFGPYADTPKTSATLYERTVLPVPSNLGEVSVRVEGYGQSSQYFSNSGDSFTPNTRLPGYIIMNGIVNWNHVGGGPVSLDFFIKNALDKGYFVGGLAQGQSLGVNAADVGEPRTYGVEARYKF